jgi:hypothetical protein
MKRKSAEGSLQKRIRSGEIRKQDVTRRLAELAFGSANDCIRLVLEEQPDLDNLDLSLLREVKRSEKGAVEIKLIDRIQALEQLAAVAGEDRSGLDDFLRALQGEEM